MSNKDKEAAFKEAYKMYKVAYEACYLSYTDETFRVYKVAQEELRLAYEVYKVACKGNKS